MDKALPHPYKPPMPAVGSTYAEPWADQLEGIMARQYGRRSVVRAASISPLAFDIAANDIDALLRFVERHQPVGPPDDDLGNLCGECEKTLAWRPIGWWINTLERKAPGLKVIHRADAP